MTDINNFIENLKTILGESISDIQTDFNEVTLEVDKSVLLDVATLLRDHPDLQLNGLMDVTAVDYLYYGVSEWTTTSATGSGFDRAVNRIKPSTFNGSQKQRFAVIYHLLSYAFNHRLRVKVYLEGDPPIIDSVVEIWPSANWFEREVFDLYGILFDKHPDLRRILTDYGFIGHPFRKDFPLSGTVEVRYDAAAGRVVYEPVDIEPRVLVPKVIREDNRYLEDEKKTNG